MSEANTTAFDRVARMSSSDWSRNACVITTRSESTRNPKRNHPRPRLTETTRVDGVRKSNEDAVRRTFKSSTSSSWCITRMPVPGTTFVSSGSPVILRPMAPSSDSCLINSDFTLVSRDGGGVSKARAVVTMGPSCVHSTIVSPACKHPLTNITSSVAPRPSTTCVEHCTVTNGLKLEKETTLMEVRWTRVHLRK